MGPEWFPQSLRALDAHVDVFLPAAMSAAIDQLGQPKVRPLPDILERSPSLDGTFRSHGRTARGAEATKSELTR